MNKKVFVTGASGLLGKELVTSLLHKGFNVIALYHEKPMVMTENSNLKLVQGDVTKKGSFVQYLSGVDIIFHLAGIVTDWAPESLYYNVHVNGTQNIIDVAIEYDIKKIIYVSTIDIFAHESGEIINENSPYTQSSVPYRRSKLIAYKLVIEAAQSNKIRPIILCPSWIYGPGDKIFIAEIVKQLKAKIFNYIGKKENYVPLIYTENLAKLMIDISEKKETVESSGTFIVSDVNIPWKYLVEQICDKINLPAPKFSIPYRPAYLAAILFEMVSRMIKKKNRPLLTRTAVETVGKSIRVDTSKLIKLCGYTPEVSLSVGLDKTISSLI